MKVHPRPSGFSLVEVTLSIAIVSFALLAVVALLPTGLQSIRNSTEQAAAAASLNTIAEALRHAQTIDGMEYRFAFQGTNSFRLDQSPPAPWEWRDLTLEGMQDSENRRIVARLAITDLPSGDHLRPGVAQLHLAWSAQGNPEFDPATERWANAAGSLSTVIHFLPSARP